MNAEQAKKLRAEFPAAVIGQLPKGGVMLDYVGHAAVTDRLLQVDPSWTWEPLALTAEGLPALDRVGNLWIKLTICGVTRLGVGDGKSAKECISDAIRNAAMRFGVALDLWSKQDLDALHDESPSAGGETKKTASAPTSPPRAAPTAGDGRGATAPADPSPGRAAQVTSSPTGEEVTAVIASIYTDADIDALVKLAEERGGDPVKTRTGAETAKAQGKLDTWLPNAHKHWEAQPVASEFETKAAKAIAQADVAQAERAAQAQADRDAAKKDKAA